MSLVDEFDPISIFLYFIYILRSKLSTNWIWLQWLLVDKFDPISLFLYFIYILRSKLSTNWISLRCLWWMSLTQFLAQSQHSPLWPQHNGQSFPRVVTQITSFCGSFIAEKKIPLFGELIFCQFWEEWSKQGFQLNCTNRRLNNDFI